MANGEIVMSESTSKTYLSSDGIRILNISQAMWYLICKVPLLDLFVSEEDGERKLVFVFSRKDTSEAYDKWCKYEAGTGAVPKNEEEDGNADEE